MVKVLFVNQPYSQCGVYQFGYNTGLALHSFKNIHDFEYEECCSKEDFENAMNSLKPDVVIFNHHPSTMQWLNSKITKNLKCALIMHDELIRMQNAVTIYPDPTFVANNKIYSVGRPLIQNNIIELAEKPLENTIGSFGFGFSHKGYADIINIVNKEFDEATIRMHIPFNTFADQQGGIALDMAEKIKKLPKKGIKLEITHDYKTSEELIYWLSENSINVFIYNNTLSKGLSSGTDWALSAKRPIATNSDKMFRHMPEEIRLDKRSLKDIMNSGIEPLKPLYEAWSNENLYKQYCGVVDEIICTSREH